MRLESLDSAILVIKTYKNFTYLRFKMQKGERNKEEERKGRLKWWHGGVRTGEYMNYGGNGWSPKLIPLGVLRHSKVSQTDKQSQTPYVVIQTIPAQTDQPKFCCQRPSPIWARSCCSARHGVSKSGLGMLIPDFLIGKQNIKRIQRFRSYL